MNFERRHVVVRLGFTGIGLAVALAACYRYYGSPANFMSYLRGQSYVVTPVQLNFGKLKAEERKEQSLQFRNLTGHALSVVGATKSCSCISMSTFPIEIPPFGLQSIDLRLDASSIPGPIKQEVSLFVSGRDGTQEIAIPIIGGVNPPDNI